MTAALTKIDAANIVLGLIAPTTAITRERGGWYVSWTVREKLIGRRWSTSRGSFFPPWYRRWGHGGTCCAALAQLIRWCRGQPVLPLSTWEYWSGERIRLGRERGPEIVQILRSAGWPETVPCVLCGETIQGGMDWWCLDRVSGPCCSMRSGCQQRRKETQS